MPQLEQIEAIEKRLWKAADTLRANSNYASNEYFDDCINPRYLQIETLERSIKLLAQARDHLLPWLMNGEIAV